MSIKISKQRLSQIIREEISAILKEGAPQWKEQEDGSIRPDDFDTKTGKARSKFGSRKVLGWSKDTTQHYDRQIRDLVSWINMLAKPKTLDRLPPIEKAMVLELQKSIRATLKAWFALDKRLSGGDAQTEY